MQNRLPDVMSVAGISSASYSWFIAATEIAQFFAAVLGIAVSAFALYFYVRRYLNERQQRKAGMFESDLGRAGTVERDTRH